jgi:hypothetical protein
MSWTAIGSALGQCDGTSFNVIQYAIHSLIEDQKIMLPLKNNF